MAIIIIMKRTHQINTDAYSTSTFHPARHAGTALNKLVPSILLLAFPTLTLPFHQSTVTQSPLNVLMAEHCKSSNKYKPTADTRNKCTNCFLVVVVPFNNINKPRKEIRSGSYVKFYDYFGVL